MATPAQKRTKKTTASLTPTSDKKRVEVKVKVPLTENILFIGSEMSYDLFWLKMMFIGATYPMAKQMRTADRVVIAYVDEGYTHLEKLAIDNLAKQCKDKSRSQTVEVKKLGSSADVTTLLNREREDYKLLDVYFSSHGVLNWIDLNYKGKMPRVQFGISSLPAVSPTAFARHGRLYSYACRTGISVEDAMLGFKSEADAKPEDSLAQKMADHFGIEVHAFLRRSFYGDVLRERSASEAISKALRDGRKISGDTAVINLPPDHEGLPHPGLANRGSSLLGTGPKGEGTDNFALWRKRGGRSLPTAASDPAGLGSGMRVFKPRV